MVVFAEFWQGVIDKITAFQAFEGWEANKIVPRLNNGTENIDINLPAPPAIGVMLSPIPGKYDDGTLFFKGAILVQMEACESDVAAFEAMVQQSIELKEFLDDDVKISAPRHLKVIDGSANNPIYLLEIEVEGG